MAVPMASLQRAAATPLSGLAGAPARTRKPNPAGGIPSSPLLQPPVPAPPAQAPPTPTNPSRDFEGEARAAADAARNAEQARRSTAPAAPTPFVDPEAESKARMEDERRRSEDFQRQRAKQLDEESRYRSGLTRAPETGAVDRRETREDDALDRESLFTLYDEAKRRGLFGPSSPMTSLTNASGGGVTAQGPPLAGEPDGTQSAASRAAFSSAKDRIGRLGSGAMASLQRAMSGRGLSGSSIEGQEIGNLVDNARGGLSDVIRDEAGFDAKRASDIEDRDYAGNLTRRGQDMAAQQESARLELARRSQQQSEIANRLSSLQGLRSLIRRGQKPSPSADARPVY